MVKDVLALEINISGAEASSHIYRFLYVRTHGFQSSGQAVPPHRYIHLISANLSVAIGCGNDTGASVYDSRGLLFALQCIFCQK